MDNINKNLSLCKKGKHKLRINKFGVTWCVRCGLLSNTLNSEPLKNKNKL